MKNVVLTGSDSGLGSYLAEEAHSRGYRVIGIDKAYAVKEIGCIGTVDVKIPCDISSMADIKRATDEIEVILGNDGLDLLINCACQFLMQPFGVTYDENTLLSATVANFIAPLLIVNNLKNALDRAEDPVVANISSNSSDGAPFCAHYCMSKGALNSLAYALNEEFRINGKIRSINFILGTLNTGFALRENYLAITPVVGKDPVISPKEVAKVIFESYESSRYLNFTDIKISPKKNHIRRDA